jgi:beta-phosphoglucomutase family hydrolase
MPDPSPTHRVDWSAHEAVLFDLDGVITPTAAIHERAWARLFADFGYRDGDYLEHIDGKPRIDGVSDFLTAKGIDLEVGDPDDPPGTETRTALGERKNIIFNEIIDAEGVAPYPGSLALIEHLERLGVRLAVVSSSKNAQRVLAAAGLGTRFGVVIDGIVAAERAIPGKPHPDTFVHAAHLLDADPHRCVVIEDALSGVAAGRAGGFGLVIGVDRGDQADALAAAGADIVVSDLAETLPPAVQRS